MAHAHARTPGPSRAEPPTYRTLLTAFHAAEDALPDGTVCARWPQTPEVTAATDDYASALARVPRRDHNALDEAVIACLQAETACWLQLGLLAGAEIAATGGLTAQRLQELLRVVAPPERVAA